jgi:hypothetical protein
MVKYHQADQGQQVGITTVVGTQISMTALLPPPPTAQPQHELFSYIADENPNIQSARSQNQPSQRLSDDGDRQSRTNLGAFYDGDRPSRTNLQDALSTTSDLPTITNAPASMVTRHGFSCIQHSATSLSVLFVHEPALTLFPLDTRHLYSSQAGLQRCSSWPAHGFEARRNARY